jgi:hypothetical protein
VIGGLPLAELTLRLTAADERERKEQGAAEMHARCIGGRGEGGKERRGPSPGGGARASGYAAPAMRSWGFRILRATFLAILAWVLYHGLDHYGRAWLFVPIVGLVFLLWVAEQLRGMWLRRQRERDWDRWENAVIDPAERPRAIAEVRQALARSLRFGERLRQEQAHLSVVLAELLDAHGRPEESARVLAKVDIGALKPSQAVVVRHAKVVAYLSAGMLDDAEAALAVRSAESGEPDMDARLDLLGAMLAIERGDPEQALQTAAEVEARLPDDGSIQAEARVLRAAALDARGDRAGAVALLRALDAGTLRSLELLGPRRIRPIAVDAQAADAPERAGEAQEGER